MNPDEFRDFVLRVIRARFPGRSVAATPDPEVVAAEGAELGLQNLYSKFLQAEVSVDGLEQLVCEHFARMFRAADQVVSPATLPWEQVEARLRPQLMPAEYENHLPLVAFPFMDAIMVGLVIDTADGYSYVTPERADDWGRTDEQLYDIALNNLNEASDDLEMAYIPPPQALIAIESKDGYDATRILLPGIRELAVERLGEPFFAGIPNRDFLLMWSVESDETFQKFTREKVCEDFQRQPYPLSPRILRVTEDDI